MSRFKERIGAAFADFLGRLSEKELAPHRRVALTSAREEIVLSEPGRELLRRAKRRASATGRHLDFVQAFAENLPFEDNSFDTVVSTLVLCSVRDQDQALAEIRRVLKPGGELIFMEHVRADEDRLARWQDRL